MRICQHYINLRMPVNQYRRMRRRRRRRYLTLRASPAPAGYLTLRMRFGASGVHLGIRSDAGRTRGIYGANSGHPDGAAVWPA